MNRVFLLTMLVCGLAGQLVLGQNPEKAAKLVSKAEAKLAKADTTKAMDFLEKALEADAGYAAAFRLRGEVQLDQRQIDAAYATYERWAKADTAATEPLILMGGLHELQGASQKALDRYAAALERDPACAQCAGSMGRVHMDMGLLLEAILELDRAIELDSTEATYLLYRGLANQLQGYGYSAKADFEAAARLSPTDTAVVGALANYAIETGDTMGVMARLKAAEVANPEWAEGPYMAGKLYFVHGQLSKALPEFDRALQVQPELIDAWIGRGVILADLGRAEDAIFNFRQALDLDPDQKEIWLYRGKLLFETGQWEAALDDLGQAIALDSAMTEAWFIRGYAHAKGKKLIKATNDFERVVELVPDAVDAWYQLGMLYERQNRLVDALAAYRELEKLEPLGYKESAERHAALKWKVKRQ